MVLKLLMVSTLWAAQSEPAVVQAYPAAEKPCDSASDDSVHARIDEVQCVSGWLERNADLGRSKDASGRKIYQKERKRARTLLKKIDGWVGSAEDQTPVVSDDAKRRAQQHYLSGIIYFQKGDYEKARDEWLLARKLDPSNDDVRAALGRVDRLYSRTH